MAYNVVGKALGQWPVNFGTCPWVSYYGKAHVKGPYGT